MEQKIQFCTTDDGVRIAYATAGSGPPLVKAANWLNHLEFDWESPIWRHLLEEFAQDHLLVRYDERGNGLSDWNVEDLSFEAFVRDLESVVDAVGLERFPLLGISQGGAVAIAYAIRHPDRVSHLILYGAYARGWAERGSPAVQEQREALMTLVRLGWGQDNPAFRQLWTTLYAPDATPEQVEWFNELQRVSTSPENAVRLFTEFSKMNVVDLLPQIKVPTIVLHCRKEAVVPFEEGRRLAALIPGAHFVPLEGRNHLLLQTEPAWNKFITEVRRFLGRDRRATVPELGKTTEGSVEPLLSRGDMLNRYAIISLIGSGGMGQVYLAEDSRLGRKVALKLFPAAFARDRERLLRFQQEARTASSLNHPNIITIYEIGEIRQQPFIASEFIEGETLRQRLMQGSLSMVEVLDIAMQIASALSAAHGSGIVHRDIKPENIMLRHDRIVKVLDFGLAKHTEEHPAPIDTEAATRVMFATQPGIVLGTVSYMSPEQARGLPVDSRTDLWSLGVVLYEMLTGRLPFEGPTVPDVISLVLTKDPLPPSKHNPAVTSELDEIILKSLSKDRDQRFRSARDLLLELERIKKWLEFEPEIGSARNM